MLLLNEILDLKQRQIGMLSAVGTYFIWGILPIYWNLMETAGADEILAHRICWSFAFMVLVLTFSNRWDVWEKTAFVIFDQFFAHVTIQIDNCLCIV